MNEQQINDLIDKKMASMTNTAIPNHLHNTWDSNQLDPAVALKGFPVIQVPVGNILTVSIDAAGTGYAVGNVLTLTGGNKNASVIVTTVSAGTITGISLINGGTGYSIATGLATTNPGTGTGATITVLTLTVATTPPTDTPVNGTFRFVVDMTPTYVFWAYLVYQTTAGVLAGSWKSTTLS